MSTLSAPVEMLHYRLRLLLIRHGQTDYNCDRRFFSITDVPLNADGEAEVRELGERIGDIQVGHVYSSYSKRAEVTAQILNEYWSSDMAFEELLAEQYYGSWEGLSMKHLEETVPGELEDWFMGRLEAPPGGESLGAVRQRAELMLSKVETAHTEETIAIVSHGGLLQAMVCVLLDATLRNFWPFRFRNAGVADVRLYEWGAVLESLA